MAGAGLRAGGPGPRCAAARPLLFLLRLLFDRRSRPRAASGRAAGSPPVPLTRARPPGQRAALHAVRGGRAPRSAPPGTASCAPGAPLLPPAPPETKARGSLALRVRPGPPSLPPLCSPRLRAPRFATALRLSCSACGRWGRGGAGGAATARAGRSGGGALAWHLPATQAPPSPPPPTSCPAAAHESYGGLGPRPADLLPGRRVLGEICAPDWRPRLWSESGVAVSASLASSAPEDRAVASIATGASAWPLVEHRLGAGAGVDWAEASHAPLAGQLPSRGITGGWGHSGGVPAQSSVPICHIGLPGKKPPDPQTKTGSPLLKA